MGRRTTNRARSAAAFVRFRKREHSIGVSVNATSSDTMIENAIVSPKVLRKRPVDAMDERDRNEDDYQRKRGRADREADFGGRGFRCRHRRTCASPR